MRFCLSSLTTPRPSERNAYRSLCISTDSSNGGAATKVHAERNVCRIHGELQQDLHDMGLVKEGKVQLIYISPELLLQNSQWRAMLLSVPYQTNLVAIAMDEAHCIVRW